MYFLHFLKGFVGGKHLKEHLNELCFQMFLLADSEMGRIHTSSHSPGSSLGPIIIHVKMIFDLTVLDVYNQYKAHESNPLPACF